MTIQAFLEQHGGYFENNRLTYFSSALEEASLAGKNFCAVLSDYAVLKVSGEDAANFLHNQLSNDVQHLKNDEARLAAYCSVKGRVLANMLVYKSDEAIYLNCAANLSEDLQQRLGRFVLRSKVKLHSTSLIVFGFTGNAIHALKHRFKALPETIWSVRHDQSSHLIRIPDAFSQVRYQWICTEEDVQNEWTNIQNHCSITGSHVWQLNNIHAGLVDIEKASQELFIPQSINLDLVEGVSFKKGCYPGQEIVARTQYLGKIKRRTLLAYCKTKLATNDSIALLADPTHVVGTVINSALSGDNTYHALIEIQLSAIQEPLCLATQTQERVELHSLPYLLQEDLLVEK